MDVMKRHTIRSGADWTPPGIAKVLDFGVGQGFCPGRGFISWNPREGPIADTLDYDCDGLVCITMGGPIVPLRAIHAFNRANDRYSYIHLRWSLGLILRTYLRFWLWIPVIMAAFLCVVVCDDWTKNWDSALWAMKGAAILLSVSGLCYVLTAINERRHRAVRLLIGPHAYGSSDPATWVPQLLKVARSASDDESGKTYGDRAVEYLRCGEFASAMWCARIATATEGRASGEVLTDRILQEPRVKVLLDALLREPLSAGRPVVAASLQPFGNCATDAR